MIMRPSAEAAGLLRHFDFLILDIRLELGVKSFRNEDSLESSRPERSARPTHQGASKQSALLGNHVRTSDGLSSERFLSSFPGREVHQCVQHFPGAHAFKVGGTVGSAPLATRDQDTA
jgi:hypothetical protein